MNASLEQRSKIIWLICLAGFALVALNAMRALPQISDLLFDADGDDVMRLVQVRDWLAGRGWYDTRQYRVLPPEGISIHWSRYVDIGIGAILRLASAVLPETRAELATVVIWPSLLACLMVLVTAHGADRLMGKAAAIGALAVFLSWSKLGGEFVPPRIDHHNVQILCSTAVFYLSLVPGRARVLGALAGAMTALSLAVGLEMLPFLAVVWAMVALRYAFANARSGDWLVGFCAAFVLAAPLLLAGQTPPGDWLTLHCDVLAVPVLTLGMIGVAATLTPVLAGPVLKGPAQRILAMVVVGGLGLWLAAPILGVCVAGPYADVTPEVRRIIEGTIVEARSAMTLLKADPELLAKVLMPPAVISLLALITAWRLRRHLNAVQSAALLQVFIIVAMGFCFALLQIRAANLMTPAIPLLGGFLVHAFTLIPKADWRRLPAILLLLLALPATVELAVGKGLGPKTGGAEGTGPAVELVPYQTCRNHEAMAELARLPKSTIFSWLNHGPAIIAFTPHSATSAAYHRSAEAFWNGSGAFGSSEDLRKALARSRADYLFLCVGGHMERNEPFIMDYLAGKLPDWLVDATGDRKRIYLFRVDKSALAKADDTP